MITILDYQAGNLTSVKRALDSLSLPNRISADPDAVRKADRIIFPGVGHAGAAMEVLKERGLGTALQEAFARGTPILGICIGCQIILSHCEEGDTAGLDLIQGECVRFHFDDPCLKVPHMGWNSVTLTQSHAVVAHLEPGDEFYFVHSYYPLPMDAGCIYATCEYGGPFPVVIGLRNLVAVQFHAEKSGPLGLQVLDNFAHWDGGDSL